MTPADTQELTSFNEERIASRVRILTGAIVFLLIGLPLIFASCSRGKPGRGTLEIRIKDHREAIDDFAKFGVAVEAIRLKPWGSWIEYQPDVVSFDLTRYKTGNSVTVFKREIESGRFEGFHLKLGEIGGILKKGNAQARRKERRWPASAFIFGGS